MFESSVKHFILGDTDEQAHIRTVIFALFTARYEFIGACHWTPITKVWDILDLCGGDHGWIIYHNNRRLSHRNVEVDQGDFFACYERSNSNPVLMDKGLFPSGDQEWIANRSSTALSSAGDATGDTFEETSHSKLIHFNRPFWHIIAAILMAKRGICCSLVPSFIH